MVTGEVHGMAYSIGVPAGWVEDTANKGACDDYWTEISVAGYTVAGACPVLYKDPNSDAYVRLSMTDSPLPTKAERVFPSVPWDKNWPGYKEGTEETVDDFTAVADFTCDDGDVKFMVKVTLDPPQVWQLGVVNAPDQAQKIFDSLTVG